MAGLGRAFVLPPIARPPDWYFCAIHLSDALALRGLEPDWLGYVWQVKDDVHALGRLGLYVHDITDDIRTLGYWRSKARLVPLDTHIPGDNVTINIDRTFAGNLRAEARFAHDDHASYRPSNRAWFRVTKLKGQGHFHELRALPIYGSIADAHNQRFAGVVETTRRSWWIELHKSESTDGEMAYMLWDSAMESFGRLFPLLEKHADGLSDKTSRSASKQIFQASQILLPLREQKK